jgi:hypothetical protein
MFLMSSRVRISRIAEGLLADVDAVGFDDSLAHEMASS